MTDNPEWEGERRNAKGDKYEDNCGMFICPVVGLEMNGKHRYLSLTVQTLKLLKTHIIYTATLQAMYIVDVHVYLN